MEITSKHRNTDCVSLTLASTLAMASSSTFAIMPNASIKYNRHAFINVYVGKIISQMTQYMTVKMKVDVKNVSSQLSVES